MAAIALVEYVTFLGRTRSFFTIQRHLASLAKHNVDSPTTAEQFKVFMKGFKLKKNVRQKQAPDFSLKQFCQAMDALPHTNRVAQPSNPTTWVHGGFQAQ